MAILITGGAGYIGSHTVKYFSDNNEEIIIIDNLQSGHQDAIKGYTFYETDLRDTDTLSKIFKNHDIEAVIHFAASSLVGESLEKPYEYYHNNVFSTLCLLDVMRENGVYNIIFSSTAATYGTPKKLPIQEDFETNPTNTYGETKLAIEKMLKWFDKAYGIKFISLRYFNAAGAHYSGNLGEKHNPETHLIPLILEVPLGKRNSIDIFGDSYETKDGTCIRDYIHVMDLASAHYLALIYLRKKRVSDVFNIGNGNGYTVKEVIDVVRKVTNHPVPVNIKPKRKGDPPILISSSDKIRRVLGWEPNFPTLEKIIKDAWNWHQSSSSD